MKEKHVVVSLTTSEAITLNNYTMNLIEGDPGDAALKRVAKKLLVALNEADQIKSVLTLRDVIQTVLIALLCAPLFYAAFVVVMLF